MAVVNVGQAKTDLSRLIARAEAGEQIEIARAGKPVVRLVPVTIESAGARFRAAGGSLRGKIRIGPDFEFSDAELDDLLQG